MFFSADFSVAKKGHEAEHKFLKKVLRKGVPTVYFILIYCPPAFSHPYGLSGKSSFKTAIYGLPDTRTDLTDLGISEMSLTY